MRSFLLFFLAVFSLWADLADFKTLRADFVQTVVNDLNKSIVYKGVVYLSAPSRARWDYKTPVEKSIYVDHDRVVVYEPDLFQATLMDAEEELDLFRAFRQAKPAGPGKYTADFRGSTLHITTENGLLQTIRFTDQVENEVTIRFSHHEKDLELDEALFIFRPGPEIDLIRQ